MNVKLFTYKNIYFIDDKYNTKLDVFNFIAKKITNKEFLQEAIINSLVDRENLSTTGFGQGNAIPHARVEGLKKSVVIMIRLSQPMDWNSLDNEPVTLIFGILVPFANAESHLDILSNIAKVLNNDILLNEVKTTVNKDRIVEIINANYEEQINSDKNQPYYLAVSACPAGLAHTYLVEAKLQQYAEDHNIKIKVETHGMKGDLNLITQSDLDRAKGLIIAVDKELDLSHLKHPNTIRVRTTDVMKNIDNVFQKLNNGHKENKWVSFFKFDLFKGIQSAIGHSYNLTYLFGLIVGLSLFVLKFDNSNNFFNQVLNISQSVALLAPSALLGFFVYQFSKHNIRLASAIFALSSGLSLWQQTSSHGSYGLIGVLLNGLIFGLVWYGTNWLINRLFKFNLVVVEGSKFLIEFAIALLLIAFIYFDLNWLSYINSKVYNFINMCNCYWWFRWLIAAIFLFGMFWDSGGIINKWTMFVATFLFFDSFATGVENLWMTPITATSLGIIIPCGSAWVRGKLCWNLINNEEKQATDECGKSFMKSISEGFLYFKNKYGWKIWIAHFVTALVVGWMVGFVNLQFFGGFVNIYGLLFSFSIDNYLSIPNLMYFMILVCGSLIGGLIHILCYLPKGAR